jgi:hypothetical protein
MKKSAASRSASKRPALLVAGFMTLAGVNPATATENDTYSWSAELVAVDQNAHTVTVQSALVSNAEVDFGRLDPGDRVTLTWSGISTAAGVRRIASDAAPEEGSLTLPIEFVSSELDGRYVRFTVPVPSDKLAKLASLSPGHWITATSPRRAANHEEAVADVRPYNDVG